MTFTLTLHRLFCLLKLFLMVGKGLNNTVFTQPLSLKPYVVPGLSPFLQSMLGIKYYKRRNGLTGGTNTANECNLTFAARRSASLAFLHYHLRRTVLLWYAGLVNAG